MSTAQDHNHELLNATLATILEGTKDIAFIKDINLIYRGASQTFADLCGVGTPLNLIGKTDREIFADPLLAEGYIADDLMLLEQNESLLDYIEPIPSLDGSAKYSSTSKYIIRNAKGEPIGIYGVARDVTREYEAQLAAERDAMTGLLNREATINSIKNFLVHGNTSGKHALFLIDIDNFKQVNDSLGHQMGDQVITDIAQLIKSTFRDNDVVGRIGGDEFFVLMKNAKTIDNIRDKAQHLITKLQYLCTAQNISIELSGSVGISVFDGNEKSFEQLYSEADTALYSVKNSHKNHFYIFNHNDAELNPFYSIVSSGQNTLNLHAILNRIDAGIIVFHAAQPNNYTVPAYISDTFLTIMGGLPRRDAEVLYKNPLDAMHPEDAAWLKQLFDESVSDGSVFRATYRTIGKDERYHWVSVSANPFLSTDGCIDIYAVYSPAVPVIDNEASMFKMLENKYNIFKYISVRDKSIIASSLLNLTHSCYVAGETDDESLKKLVGIISVDELFQKAAERISEPSEAERFVNMFSRTELLRQYADGNSNISMEFPYQMDDKRVAWVRTTVNMMQNPKTNDIEAIVSVLSIDHEKNLSNITETLIATDYELLCQIDANTGNLLLWEEKGVNKHSGSEYRDYFYDDKLLERLRHLISDEYIADAVSRMSRENIIRELETKEVFTCIFPTKEHCSIPNGYKQWSFSYPQNSRAVIHITRKDVTSILMAERNLLTGLYTQQVFYEYARGIIQAHPDITYAIVRFDLNRFKAFNDLLGTHAGDILLAEIGKLLRHYTIEGERIFAHLQADHFAGIMPVKYLKLTQGQLDDATGLFESYANTIRLSASIGVYVIDDPNIDISLMCDRALLAQKTVKGSYETKIAWYDNHMRQALLEEQELLNDIERALQNNEFLVYFQPQVNSKSSAFFGAEALVRWQHPTRGLLSPNSFIPLLEKNGLISKLDEYVWDKTCEYLRRWSDMSISDIDFSVSVNVSRLDFYDKQLLSKVLACCERHGIPTSMLKLEITESAYMDNPEILISTVNELQAAGFVVELDDFGVGYSSLAAFNDIPVNILKLDVRFLNEANDDSRRESILRAIIKMSEDLDVPVIAEGVETSEQVEYLKDLGCHLIQGYYFGKPMSADDFEKSFISDFIVQDNQ